MIKTAVVILNWNGEAMLRQFLPSVVAGSCEEETVVYVADNASTDDSCAVVEKEFPSVHLIRLDKNYGFAEGYNRALQRVEAEYVVLLNSDVEVTEGWLQDMVAYMDTHPDTAACQPKILSYRHRNMFEYAGAGGGFIDRYGYPFCRGRVFDAVEEDRGQYDEIVPVFWATGAALMIRLEVYRKVGGLDARFFAHMEEIDLCWRLRSRGYQLVCVPSSTVYHVGGATLKKDNPRKTFLNFRNNLLMLYKNLPEEELAPVMRIRTFLDYCAALVWLLKGDWANVKAVREARREFHSLRPQFVADRQQNLAQTVLKMIPERYAFSLVWQAKVKGRKTFSALLCQFH
ncbi:MAG TPA: glycosyltransferase family 2 protein [Bacteroides mediterraneensis]|uniref:glycosyltransferase family 2 protein n=1 Tax=Bacteroides mediterraneensis TaxID=1841856 RepID=UPI002607A754|nr:glycosyltransferase family 2 protein [Bacteroides mediterraneensis]HJH65560.1 glycosyltransferase family 2 protein [Bacteroides mediterraneensis]